MSTWIVTGGCGFIGSNVTERLLADGITPVVIDNVSRPRVHRNLIRLRDRLGVECHVADVRDAPAMHRILGEHAGADVVLHLAGQVSFAASLAEPRYDFETNAMGTFNVLEACRSHAPEALVIYSSTNKVYGDLASLTTVERETRYELTDYPAGLPADLPLHLHGGYGCSKGAADQLVLDWAACYGLATVSLRQSSVYGGHQFATEDQGWAAYFAEQFVRNSPFGISGTGKQVRDLLHVKDLYSAYRKVHEHRDAVSGRAFNVGGGMANSASLLELFIELESRTCNRPEFERGPERPFDQRVFVSDNHALARATGWQPSMPMQAGLDELVAWARELVGAGETSGSPDA